jgi:hypothetical protein
VSHRIQPLRVGERFPVRLKWPAALVPAGALLILFLALFYKPQPRQPVEEGKEPLAKNQAVADDIKEQMKKLQKKPERKVSDRPRSQELDRLEDERDRLSRAPTDTRDQARDRVKEMGSLEEQMHKRDKELAQRADALKQQLKQVDRLANKEKKNGPARNVDRAMEQGDFKKAKDEVERLAKQLEVEDQVEKLRKKLKDPQLAQEERDKLQKELDNLQGKQLSKEQKEQVREQMKDLQGKLERLTRKQEMEDKLRDLARNRQIDPEQLQRELDQLERNFEKLDPETQQMLKDLAQKLGECQQCLGERKDGEAGAKLEEAAAQLAKLDPNGERQELGKQIAMLQQARRALCQALDGNNPASGRRPDGKAHDTKEQEKQARSELDKGNLQIVDHLPGEGFKAPRKPAELTEEIRQAAQDASEAIDRQRLSKSASEMAKGFFEKMRGQDKDAKKAP